MKFPNRNYVVIYPGSKNAKQKMYNVFKKKFKTPTHTPITRRACEVVLCIYTCGDLGKPTGGQFY